MRGIAKWWQSIFKKANNEYVEEEQHFADLYHWAEAPYMNTIKRFCK